MRLETSKNEGLSIHKNLSVRSAGAVIKASQGCLYGFTVYNKNAAAVYLKFYDKATTPTVGTDVPVMTIAIPTGTTLTIGPSAFPIAFTAGIGVGVVTGVADNNTTDVAANDVVLTALYA